MLPITFPIVNAAMTVPIPRPSICPRKIPVRSPVTARQVRSQVIFTLEYFQFLMADTSLGNKSVGIIGSPQRLDNATPKAINR